METKIFRPTDVAQAAQLIQAGQLVAFPTETVYGLGADATNVTAVKQVYQAKGRPSDNPLIVHVADVATVERFTQPLSVAAKKLIKAFWPGPLTMIFKLKPAALAPEVTGGLMTAAFRNPNNAATLALIRTAQTPIVGPSANTSGKPSPTTAQHVYHDLAGKIAGILDDGATKVGVESTVLDLSGTQPAILRPGAVTAAEIEAVIDETVLTEQQHVGVTEVPKAPGMKYKHYAPDAQVYIVDQPTDWPQALTWARQQAAAVGVMATDVILTNNQIPANCEQFSLGTDIQSASRELFAGLRHFDTETDIKIILCQAFENKGLGAAYMNRLNKSAGQTHFSV
ncbi:threonylcarbamoyl-AMP synthase [Lactobacillus sp. CBA3606]|uniref:L-threonylcarbamoyladenylate synthase n=1 Tax=Lactobacillus sp. CBA3606 TaxID=2099789 RepID=UPI000CFB5F7E|nr:L-threonylcarbamoyladenylate synthase [Lactobacillus sp. CBA3606]AVK63420.1 threonylcarbamoyl-AMP synthase [Lactobacillus sp. CBA3606]